MFDILACQLQRLQGLVFWQTWVSWAMCGHNSNCSMVNWSSYMITNWPSYDKRLSFVIRWSTGRHISHIWYTKNLFPGRFEYLEQCVATTQRQFAQQRLLLEVPMILFLSSQFEIYHYKYLASDKVWVFILLIIIMISCHHHHFCHHQNHDA